MNTLNNPIVETTIPSSRSSPSQSNKIIDAALQTGIISQDGYNWLMMATDPYHDTPITHFSGIPDDNEGMSVCMVINDSVQINKPSSFGASSTWNARITVQPTMSTADVMPVSYRPNAAFCSVLTPVGRIASVQIDYSEGVNDFNDFGDYIGGSSSQLYVPDSQLVGPTKLAGLGVEVIDTTAQIYKQGLISCIDMNQSSVPTAISCAIPSQGTTVPGFSGVFDAYTVRTPPRNLGDMVKYQPIAQWEAKDGAYAVAQLKSVGTYPANTTFGVPLLLNEDFAAGPNRTLTTQRLTALSSQTPITNLTQLTPVRLCPLAPLNTKVIMLTGLSPQASYVVRARWIIEKYPNDFEPQILPMVTPTAALDPHALEIYSRVAQGMAPMVPLAWNSSRKWWKSVLSDIADTISAGLLMIPHPLAKGAGVTMQAMKPLINSALSSAVDVAVGPPNSKKKKAKRKQLAASVVVTPAVRRSKPLPPIPRKP